VAISSPDHSRDLVGECDGWWPELGFAVWFGLFAPKGASKDVIRKLNVAAIEAVANPAVRSLLADPAFEIFPREKHTPDWPGPRSDYGLISASASCEISLCESCV